MGPSQLREAVLCGAAPNQARARFRKGIDGDEIKHFVIDCSKGLAELTKSKKNPTVQFIHESVRGFLLEDGRLQSLWPDISSNFPGQSQERLKQCCLDYCRISLGDAYLSVLKLKQTHRAATRKKEIYPLTIHSSSLREQALEAFPFLEYAVRNVLYHADAAEGSGVDQEQFLASFPLSDWIKLESVVEEYASRRHGEDTSFLYILSEYNAPNLIKCYPNNLSGFEKENQRYGLPILAALATRSHKAALALMKAHADNEPRNSVLHDICRQYAGSGDDELDDRAYPSRLWRFVKNDSAFSNLVRGANNFIVDFALTSAQCNPAEVEERLLEYTSRDTTTARVLLKHDSTRVLLYKDIAKLKVWAASHGFTGIMQTLIDRDGTTETPELGNTLLLAAARAGRTEVVQILLERNVSVEAEDSDGTPLSEAIKGGHEAAAQLLLDNGANVKAVDEEGQTPLSWAARSGKETAVRLLLNNSANIKAANKTG